jgi:hypothetical protein
LRFTLSSVPVLLALLLSGCAGFHENTPPAPHAAPAAHVAKVPPTTAGQEVALRALMLVKEGYRYGGKTLRTGLDCSGMVSYVYKAATGRTLAALEQLRSDYRIYLEEAGYVAAEDRDLWHLHDQQAQFRDEQYRLQQLEILHPVHRLAEKTPLGNPEGVEGKATIAKSAVAQVATV